MPNFLKIQTKVAVAMCCWLFCLLISSCRPKEKIVAAPLCEGYFISTFNTGRPYEAFESIQYANAEHNNGDQFSGYTINTSHYIQVLHLTGE